MLYPHYFITVLLNFYARHMNLNNSHYARWNNEVTQNKLLFTNQALHFRFLITLFVSETNIWRVVQDSSVKTLHKIQHSLYKFRIGISE